jgi:hypothetical protein
MIYAIAAITLVFAVLRFIVPVTGHINHADVFKDLAHLWVGFCYGYGIAKSLLRPVRINPTVWIAIFLTAVEVAAFFIRKG